MAWKLIEKLCAKFKLGDTIEAAEQLEKLMKLKLKKKRTRSILKARPPLSKLVMGAKLMKS